MRRLLGGDIGKTFKVQHLVKLTEEVLYRYRLFDRRIRIFQLRTGLRCPRRCGVCCQSSQVEASILECLPLAREIFRCRKAEDVAWTIEQKEREGDPRCVLFDPDEEGGAMGRCLYYARRPLVCRLFGYAARRDKTGRLEFRPCRVMRADASHTLSFSHLQGTHDADPLVYQDCFLQIGSIDPGMGMRLFPINTALKKALEHVYWQCPEGRFPRPRKAA